MYCLLEQTSCAEMKKTRRRDDILHRVSLILSDVCWSLSYCSLSLLYTQVAQEFRIGCNTVFETANNANRR